MVWSTTKERPKRYLISVGRDRLREKVMEDLWNIVDSEGSSMADEVWDALFMHVERHKKIDEDLDGDFDDVVANESAEAHEEVVNRYWMQRVELSVEWRRAICLDVREHNERRKGRTPEYV